MPITRRIRAVKDFPTQDMLFRDITTLIADLIATGGTALAAIKLVHRLGGEVVEFAAVVDLPDIGGSRKFKQTGVEVYCQTQFEGH